MRFKEGVIKPNRIEIYKVLWAAEDLYVEHGRLEGVTVTSGMDGRHRRASLHYSGDAVDLRTRFWHPDVVQVVAAKLRALVGDKYDIVIESDHLHCEYQPKTSPQVD